MKIRKASKRDIDKLICIEISSGYHKNPNEQEIRNLLINFFNSAHPYAFIIQNTSNCIGYTALRVIKSNCEVDYLAIIEKHQRRGLGKLLLNKILLFAKEKKCKVIKLSVRQNNKVALSLYKKYGFCIIKRNKNKLFMEKEIK